MSSSHVQTPAARKAASSQQAMLDALAGIVAAHVRADAGGMAARMGAALADLGQDEGDARAVYRRVKSARLLKENGYAFVHLAGAAIERVLGRELERCAPQAAAASVPASALGLVPLEEIDGKLALGALARPFDIAHAEALATLGVRLGLLLGRGMLRADVNPFRPAIFLEALQDAWREFEPDAGAHDLIQPLLNPDIVFDLAPLFEALVAALRQGGQPGSVDALRIQKTDDAAAARAARAGRRAQLADRLRELFGDEGGEEGGNLGVPLIPDLPALGGAGGWRPSGAAGFLAAGMPAAAVPMAAGAVSEEAASTGGPAVQAASGFVPAVQGNAPAAQPMPGFAAVAAMPAAPSAFQPAGPAAVTAALPMGAIPVAGPVIVPLQPLHTDSPTAASPVAPLPAAPVAAWPAALPGLLAAHGGTAPLLALLAGIEPALAQPTPVTDGSAAPPHNVFYLPRLKQSLPQGSLPRGDARTLDLLSRVFETVLLDDSIPPRARELLQLLQVPVLKAALRDKDFFFEEAHPARRLVDLLSQLGWGLDGGSDADTHPDATDPLFQAMRRSVAQAKGEGADAFAGAVAHLEAGIAADERAREAALAAPVASALRQEKLDAAGRAARDAVALRLQAGEVDDMVGAFLDRRWTTVMTFAFSIEGERPGAVGNATRAMDDLIWSVRPKATQEGRKALLKRLPRLLATLNKWLDAIKWQDAERLQFFARLAECHAAIVRAPIELSPERQLELAVEAAQRDALRRVELENAAAAQLAEQQARQAGFSAVDGLERGMWVEFRMEDGPRKARLAWVSPLRTLFIFAGAGRREAFSLPAEKLAAALHDGSARVLAIDGVVGQVLAQALGQGAVNDQVMADPAGRHVALH